MIFWNFHLRKNNHQIPLKKKKQSSTDENIFLNIKTKHNIEKKLGNII